MESDVKIITISDFDLRLDVVAALQQKGYCCHFYFSQEFSSKIADGNMQAYQQQLNEHGAVIAERQPEKPHITTDTLDSIYSQHPPALNNIFSLLQFALMLPAYFVADDADELAQRIIEIAFPCENSVLTSFYQFFSR
jgi:hypothetical protein